ncbi:hypothetical protein AVHY2522_07625 [Acidovorax sp. SUPP2522]|nr:MULTISPECIES: hypothetical protein [unclassified Acidovorax]GKT15292.1 hypothetical protein AVHY2522_07625 [Acidovorax sp. SUPP2522]
MENRLSDSVSTPVSGGHEDDAALAWYRRPGFVAQIAMLMPVD